MSAPVGNNLAVLLTELTAGRNPGWLYYTAGTPAAWDPLDEPPKDINDGISLLDGDNGTAITTMVMVQPRENSAFRTARISFTVTNTALYTLAVTGSGLTGSPVSVNYTSDGSATAPEIVAGLKAAVEANANLHAYMSANADPENGDKLLLAGKTGPAATPGPANDEHWTITTLTNGGGADPTCLADAHSCDIVVKGYPGGHKFNTAQTIDPTTDQAASATQAARSNWSMVNLVNRPSPLPSTLPGVYIDFRGYCDAFSTAGRARLHVQVKSLLSVAGESAQVTLRVPDVFVGPCRRESAVTGS
mgnify:FL=1|tara:strand:+ start:642 stop:1553 length:912 start_codon:yes stop_codon:yes gene_type:complete